jgi:hypothetical protein
LSFDAPIKMHKKIERFAPLTEAAVLLFHYYPLPQKAIFASKI